jgi:2-hydroxychromene-2-carboxylate isomerase
VSAAVEITVLFDFKDPHSYLAVAPTRSMLETLPVRSHWYPFLGSPMRQPVRPESADDRGGWHRYHRAVYLARDLCRYAEARRLPARHFHDGGLYRQVSGEIAVMGYNWATGAGPEFARSYMDQTFEGYWDGALDLDDLADVTLTLMRSGVDVDGFDVYCQQEGVEELLAQRADIGEAGGFATPSCLLDGEAFVGRQHLPYLAERVRRKLEEEDRV